MKQKTISAAVFIFLLLGLQLASADIITPTLTKVYFEQAGKPYTEKIDFTVKGYGYSWPVGPGIQKQPGTYTPEVVFSFSATYNSYGAEIHENYYMNYRHIDYFEVEGRTADGRIFVIKNITSIPTSCVDINPEEGEEYQTCMDSLVRPAWINPSNQSTGATRIDYQNRTWTKGSDGMWTSPDEPGLKWGDIIWNEVDKTLYTYNQAKKTCEKILDNSDTRKCEIRLNLDDAVWNNTVKKSFWSRISCFFKGLFGRSC